MNKLMSDSFLSHKKSLIYLFFIFLIIIYLSNYIFLSELTNPNIFFHWYNQDQYLINYNDHGFVKRGLIGFIFKINLNNYNILTKIIVTINLCLILTLYLLIINSFKNIELKKYLILFSISPFFLYQLGFDFGRFDHFGILIFLLIVLFIIQNRSILFFEILLPFTILIHEILFFSLVIFVIYFQILIKRNRFIIYYTIFSSFLILILLFFFGGMEPEYIDKYKDKYWFVNTYFTKGHLESSMSLWLTDVFKFNTTIFYRHFISILIFIYCLSIIFKKSNDLFLKSILIIFSLSFILGIDHARFLSIFFFNLTMIYLIKLKRNEIYFQLPKFKNYFWLIVFMGPWGVNICLPILTILKKAIFYGTLTFN